MVEISQILQNHDCEQSALLPILHEIMAQNGLITNENMREIADYLNLSRAEIYGVVSFYHDFKIEPEKADLHICMGESCQAQGAQTLFDKCNIEGQKPAKIFCLGLCSRGPAAMKDGKLIAEADLAFGGMK